MGVCRDSMEDGCELCTLFWHSLGTSGEQHTTLSEDTFISTTFYARRFDMSYNISQDISREEIFLLRVFGPGGQRNFAFEPLGRDSKGEFGRVYC